MTISHTDCIYLTFSTVCFQMSPQIAWLSSTMSYHAFPQIACMKGYKVTLAAFVWLFSTVHFQIYPQSACMRVGEVTLIAFVWFFSTVCFQIRVWCIWIRACKVFCVCVSSNACSNCLHERLHSCNCCIWLIYLCCLFFSPLKLVDLTSADQDPRGR